MSVELLQLGSTAIGVKTKEGVVLAVEKRITSPLLVCLLTFSIFLFNKLNLESGWLVCYLWC